MGTPPLPWAAWARPFQLCTEGIFPTFQPEPPQAQPEAVSSHPHHLEQEAEPSLGLEQGVVLSRESSGESQVDPR